MAATTGPLSTCSSPVLFLIAREWHRNKHLHRILFTESLLNPDKVFYMRGGQVFLVSPEFMQNPFNIPDASIAWRQYFSRRGFPFSLPRSFTFSLCGDVLVQEVLTVVEARPDWRYPALRLSLIFLPLSLPPY